jgi:hypothetical protein
MGPPQLDKLVKELSSSLFVISGRVADCFTGALAFAGGFLAEVVFLGEARLLLPLLAFGARRFGAGARADTGAGGAGAGKASMIVVVAGASDMARRASEPVMVLR